MAAADVGDRRAPLQLGHDPVERGQPLGDQVRVVAGPEEALTALVHVVHVLVPAEPGAAARRLGDLRRVEHRAQRDLEEPGQVGGAVRIGERHGLLRRQGVAAAVRVVVDIAARRLGVQPLADVALGGPGALGQFGGRQRARPGQGPVEAEFVAHHDQRGVQGGADFVHRAEYELHELVAVDLGGLLGSAHGVPPWTGFPGERRFGAAGLASGGPPSPAALLFPRRTGCLESRHAAGP